MLRFFRQIRQRLLTQNKLSKYLLYVIMEVFIVIIGILIAIRVDNWNQQQQERQDAMELYRNIRGQLLQDQDNIRGQVLYNNRHMPAYNYAIDLIETDLREKKDTLRAISANLADYSDFDRQGNIYTRLANSGDAKLLKNEAINNRLRQLEETYIYVNRMETIHYDFIMRFMPELIQIINMPSKRVIDEDDLYGGALQNIFALSLRIMSEKAAVYLRALEEIEALIALIDSELDNS
jgi:hypothetical protein